MLGCHQTPEATRMWVSSGCWNVFQCWGASPTAANVITCGSSGQERPPGDSTPWPATHGLSPVIKTTIWYWFFQLPGNNHSGSGEIIHVYFCVGGSSSCSRTVSEHSDALLFTHVSREPAATSPDLYILILVFGTPGHQAGSLRCHRKDWHSFYG